MHSQTRLLPRLDQLYLQKQSYDAHKKNLTSIKRSGSLSKRSLNHSHLQQNEEETKSIHSLSQSTLKLIELTSPEKPHQLTSQNHMETIQQAKPGLSYWLKKMNPLQKRLKQQQLKENKRMRQKIKNTMSFVVQSNKLNSHAEHYKGMKNMLNKFQIDHDSKKTKLKCQIVLKKITEIQKEKLKVQQSRILQFQKYINSSKQKLNMSKNTEILAKLQKKEKFAPLANKNRLLSEKINLVTRRSTRTMNNTALLKNQNTIKRNLAQHKDSLLTRNRSQFTSKTSSLVRNLKEGKTFTPKLGNQPHSQRIKTQQLERNQPKRLFNSSKLSNLSTETAPQTKLKKDYKILKVNFTQNGQVYKRPLDEKSEKGYKNDYSNNGSLVRNNIASRIRTEVNQESRIEKLSRQSSTKRFEYQKKRIERYIKSKSSLNNIKDLPDSYLKKKQFGNANSFGESSKMSGKVNEKRSSIVQQKIEQKMEESMQTIDAGKNQQTSKYLNNRGEIKKGDTKQLSAYFATQII